VAPQLVLPEIRGRMEASLASIARGEREPEEVVRSILDEFLEYYDQLRSKQDLLASRLSKALEEVIGDAEKSEARKGARLKARGGRRG